MFPAELEDRYEVLRPLGEGGYGSVYLVRDRRLGRELALKVLDGIAADPTQLERFRREARVTSQLQHAHVVQVFDHGDLPEGRAYIGYEFVEGQDLAAVLERREAIPLGHLVTWGASIADALQAAHDLGIVHRDLKPANILLRADGQALLCDFGVARLDESQTVQTREGLILGTPSYVAPEVWYGDAPGPAADQFALAATLYELLYRRRPFPSDEPTEIWEALKAGWRPAPPKDRAGEYPVLQKTLLRALHPRPERRFPSVGEFGKALQRTEGTHGFVAPGREPSHGATLVVEAPSAELTNPAGATRRTLRPEITRTQAWPVGRRGAAALATLAALLGGGLWLALRSGPPGDPAGPAPTDAPGPPPAWAEALEKLQDARDRLPAVIHTPPPSRHRHHVQESLAALMDPRLELALGRYLDAQLAWLRALTVETPVPWDSPSVRASLVRDVLAPIHGATTTFATLHHAGARVFGDTLDLDELGVDRGDFVRSLLDQKERLHERLWQYDQALKELPGPHPPSLRMTRAFLALFFLGDRRLDGFDRDAQAREVLAWTQQFSDEDPRLEHALGLAGWVGIRAAYMGYSCEVRLELAQSMHSRALAAEGEGGTVRNATTLQVLKRAGMVLVRVLRSCEELVDEQVWARLDEIIDTLEAYAGERPVEVRIHAREIEEMFYSMGGRRRAKKSPDMLARIERLRRLREETGG